MSKKANPYENFLNVLDSAAALDGIDQNDYASFRYPEQELKVNFPVRKPKPAVEAAPEVVTAAKEQDNKVENKEEKEA